MELELLAKDGGRTTVQVEQSPWSGHPRAGTVSTARMKAALKRIGAHQVSECSHSAREVWSYHGGYFVAWETA